MKEEVMPASIRCASARVGIVVLICTLVSGHLQAKPKPGPRTIPVAARVNGVLTFQINGAVVDVAVSGTGQAGSLGKMVATAEWSPSTVGLTALFLGTIDELSINEGTFSAQFESGDTVTGTLAGTIHARNDGRFALDAEFVVTSGTGGLTGATGTGTLRALQDTHSLESLATLQVKLTVP
jgi:hypothetical protein